MIYTYEYDMAYHRPALPVVEIEVSMAEKKQNRFVLRALAFSP